MLKEILRMSIKFLDMSIKDESILSRKKYGEIVIAGKPEKSILSKRKYSNATENRNGTKSKQIGKKAAY